MGEYINSLTVVFIVVGVVMAALIVWTSWTKSGREWLKNL